MDLKQILKESIKKKKDDPCWDDHVQLGTKKKNGKEVPNCVPKESMNEDVHDDLNDIVFDFQKKTANYNRKNLDADIAKQLKEIDSMLDDLRSDLFKIRSGK